MKTITLWLISVLILWTAAAYVFSVKLKRRDIFRIVNLVLAAVSMIVIFYMTVVRRGGGSRALRLIPFYSFYLARSQKEFYRTMFMNAAFFVPVGLFLPYVESGRKRGRLLRVLLLGIVYSLLIEILQYSLLRGQSEADDVIMNTLGVLIGEISYYVYSRLRSRAEGKNQVQADEEAGHE